MNASEFCIECILVQNVDEVTDSAFTALTWHAIAPITSTVSRMMDRGDSAGECSKGKIEVSPAPRDSRGLRQPLYTG